MNRLIHVIEEKKEGVFEMQFACEILKLVSGSKAGYAPLNAENNLSVTFCFIAVYAHEKLNILVSVLNSMSFFYDFNLNTQDFVYTRTF